MPKRPRLVRDKDYVITDDGQWEFTSEYLLGLGECCKNNCRFCPYQNPAIDVQVYPASAAIGNPQSDADRMLK